MGIRSAIGIWTPAQKAAITDARINAKVGPLYTVLDNPNSTIEQKIKYVEQFYNPTKKHYDRKGREIKHDGFCVIMDWDIKPYFVQAYDFLQKKLIEEKEEVKKQKELKLKEEELSKQKISREERTLELLEKLTKQNEEILRNLKTEKELEVK